ncbi:MAG: hypothetical protein ABWX92_18275 [Mycetocola sp.]
MPDFDFSELMSLAADLGEVPRETIPNVRKAVEVSARNVKDDWKKGAKRSGLKRYAASIDYDMQLDTDGSIGADIGPNLGRTGGSFGFVEDAPGGVLSAPQHAGRAAAKNVEADFIDGILKATEGI